MPISLKKADFELNKCGRSIDNSDPLAENYIALAESILGKKVNLAYLEDDKEAKRRMRELDAIYARGDKPPLAKQFPRCKGPEQDNSKKGKPVKIINLSTGEEFKFKTIKDVAEYLRKEEGGLRSHDAYCELIRRKEQHNNFKIELDRSKYKSVNRGKSTISIAIGMKNIKTGEKLEFISMTKCIECLRNIYGTQASTELIKGKIKRCKTYKGEWMFYYLQEQGGK